MPSFRTVFALAATAFAALSSAAPIEAPALPNLPGVSGVAGNLPNVGGLTSGGLPNVGGVTNVAKLPIRRHGNEVEVVDAELNILNAGKRHDQLRSLPEILNDTHDKLAAVSDKLIAVIGVKAVVEVEVILPIIDEVKGIVFTAVGAVQAIVNHPQEFVLALAGKVLSIPEVAKLLVTVLALLATILATALRVVGAASAHLVAPVIAGVGAVLCELLSAIFACVGGLLVVVVPIAGPVIATFTTLGFTNVVGILKL